MKATCRRSSPRSLTSTRRRPVTTLDSPAIHTYRSSVWAGSSGSRRRRGPRRTRSSRGVSQRSGSTSSSLTETSTGAAPSRSTAAAWTSEPSAAPSRGSHTHLDPGRRRQLLDVGAQRHLAQRRTDRVTRQVAQDPGDRRQRGLVAHEQDPARVAGRELDAAVLVAAPRRHRHQPVARPWPAPPRRCPARPRRRGLRRGLRAARCRPRAGCPRRTRRRRGSCRSACGRAPPRGAATQVSHHESSAPSNDGTGPSSCGKTSLMRWSKYGPSPPSSANAGLPSSNRTKLGESRSTRSTSTSSMSMSRSGKETVIVRQA